MFMWFYLSTLYQLALMTPGMSPERARERKQMRHNWNFLRYPRGRPHRRQRVYLRTANFGARWDFAISDVLATLALLRILAQGKDRARES
jgi:hypothetical protein